MVETRGVSCGGLKYDGLLKGVKFFSSQQDMLNST